MKTLYFIRHAKSSWEHPISDHNRPLNKRGFEAAYKMANFLKQKEIKVDKAYCSTANRAVTTADIIFPEIKTSVTTEIQYTKELYDFLGASVIKTIKEIPNQFFNISIFGHNPAFTDLVNQLGSIQFENIPTCGVVCIEFDINNWSLVSKGKTKFHIFPKDI